MLAIHRDPAHETAWGRGADGEERTARALSKHLTDPAIVLHDRRIRGSRANIDHLVIAPSGVWVIDSKRCKGKVSVRKPLFARAQLTIAGRDRTKFIDGLKKQVALVMDVMDELGPNMPVHGALCVLDGELPIVSKLTIQGFPILYPRPLAKRINRDGPASSAQIRATAALLAERFPAA